MLDEWDVSYRQWESGNLKIFFFTTPNLFFFLYMYKISLNTCQYPNLNFMEYPECEICSSEILVTKVL